MNFTAKDVSDLRAQTGIGMMECKKALAEANGDKEEAIKILREKGLAVAEKKASRIAAEGVVDILAADGAVAMVEVNSETDFVAKNETFKAFVKGVLETILANKPADVEALLACKFAGSEDTVDAALKEKTFQIGEKLSIRRFVIVEEAVSASYVHGGGTIGVIVYGTATVGKDEAAAVLRNAALQVAAMNPLYTDKDSVPEADVNAEKEIILAQIKNDEKNAKKPEAVLEKMVIGKIGKFYSEKCLTEQEYVKAEGKETVSEYIAAEAKKLGGEIKLTGFVRYEKGEGLEKREDNFAEEIAKLTQK
ncbi:MAG: translation elongation factor Ts [Eubacteriales bacterium]